MVLNVYQQVQNLDKKCRVYGCRNIEYLEKHHIIPRSQGGPNKLWNIITFCEMHHKMITERKLDIVNVLIRIMSKKDFRWQQALDWHLSKQQLKDLKNNRDT